MSNFKHQMTPSRNKPLQQKPSVNPIRVASVNPPEDEEQYPEDDEEYFEADMAEMEAQTSVVESSKKLSPSELKQLELKKKLENLVMFKAPRTKSVEICGVKFTLKRLNPDETFEIFQNIKKLPEEEQLSKIEAMTLAGSIVDIDGIKLEDLYSGPQEIEDPLIKGYLELCTFDNSLLRVLANVYTQFVKEAEEEYTPTFLDKK